MAAVVGVHGIAQQFGGGYELGTVWYDALRDGLSAAGYRPAADALVPPDLRLAFFGGLFRPSGVMAAQEPPFSAADVEPGLERDLLTEFYQAVVEQAGALGAPEGAMGLGKAGVQVMLDRLLRSRTFAGVAQRALIGNLKQVTRFLADGSVKISCWHAWTRRWTAARGLLSAIRWGRWSPMSTCAGTSQPRWSCW